jgi:tetratricopeptide (TPR) repeat protein/flagellar motor protein MotB
MNNCSFTFLLLLFALPLFAQKEEVPPLYIIPEAYSQIHHQGEVAMLNGQFEEALRHFKKVLKKYPDFAPARRSIGACYELKGDFQSAADNYRYALDHNSRFSRALYYEVGNIYYKTGNYKMALDFFKEFELLKELGNQEFTYNGVEERKIEESYYEKLPASIRACQIALDSFQYMNIASVANLGNGVNSKADEYFPFLTNDGNTIFYTSRKNEQADEDLFTSSFQNNEWKSGGQAGNFNTSDNEGMTSLVRDGRRLFFTACGRPAVEGTCDIWEGNLGDGYIFDLRPLIGAANSGKWESQASASCDGTALFFASNREGGLGGTDIWVSLINAEGKWGEPKNLGPNINTPGDEEAPFITNDGKVLYFSSTGHLGMGEQDIFMSRAQDNGDWGNAVNLGPPVNSAFRELGFFLSADGKTGYFSSNRSGGYGGMDIYRFEVPQALFSEPITYVEGWVQDSITRIPVKTTVYFKGRPAIKTDDDGRFFLCIKAGESLDIDIRDKDYHPYRHFRQIPNWDNKVFYKMDLLLDPLFKLPAYQGNLATGGDELTAKGIGLEKRHTVLFEFDGAELLVEAEKALDEFFQTTIKGKEVLNVEIIGFADDVGTDSYNLVLSEKRAKAVGVHLKQKGVKVDKIYIEGRGEQDGGKPKWENRKVEVVVTLAK